MAHRIAREPVGVRLALDDVVAGVKQRVEDRRRKLAHAAADRVDHLAIFDARRQNEAIFLRPRPDNRVERSGLTRLDH